jgi:hypothetical protein
MIPPGAPVSSLVLEGPMAAVASLESVLKITLNGRWKAGGETENTVLNNLVNLAQSSLI